MKKYLLPFVPLLLIIAGYFVFINKQASVPITNETRPEVVSWLELFYTSDNDKTNTWSVYRDEMFGFEIKYPSDWIPDVRWSSYAADWREWIEKHYTRNLADKGSQIRFFEPDSGSVFIFEVGELNETTLFEDSDLLSVSFGSTLYSSSTVQEADSNISIDGVLGRVTGASDSCFEIIWGANSLLYNVEGVVQNTDNFSPEAEEIKNDFAAVVKSIKIFKPTVFTQNPFVTSVPKPDTETQERYKVSNGVGCETKEEEVERLVREEKIKREEEEQKQIALDLERIRAEFEASWSDRLGEKWGDFTLEKVTGVPDAAGMTFSGTTTVRGNVVTNPYVGLCFRVEYGNTQLPEENEGFCFNHQGEQALMDALNITEEDINSQESKERGWKTDRCIRWPAEIVISGFSYSTKGTETFPSTRLVEVKSVGEKTELGEVNCWF